MSLVIKKNQIKLQMRYYFIPVKSTIIFLKARVGKDVDKLGFSSTAGRNETVWLLGENNLMLYHQVKPRDIAQVEYVCPVCNPVPQKREESEKKINRENIVT